MERLTFKELLKEELERGKRINRSDEESTELAAERYKNRENQHSESLILSYRSVLEKACDNLLSNWGVWLTDEILIEPYQDHFGITEAKEGKI